jgi:uncharacterized membrane-anchored protein YitT (DUF2179 family)
MSAIIKYKENIIQWSLITIGCMISAIGYVLFVIPSNMIEGGSTGIGIIVQNITGGDIYAPGWISNAEMIKSLQEEWVGLNPEALKQKHINKAKKR